MPTPNELLHCDGCDAPLVCLYCDDLSIENEHHNRVVAGLVYRWFKQYDESEWIGVLEELLRTGQAMEVVDANTQ